MNSFWIKTNWFVKRMFSNYTWDIPNNENKIYLTFDDGPTPKITEWVLNQLLEYNAKATFFCIGKNAHSYPEILEKIIQQGHAIGNHTNNHLNGWKTTTENYLENCVECEEIVYNTKCNSLLFRPPYGKIKRSQSIQLRKKGYRIIMWDVLSCDFDRTISVEKCLKNVLNNTNSGSVIVFHDSEKAFRNLEYTLPKALAFFKNNGYLMEGIS
jgi:peptidoglycan/xylan/chitin deacetylase (PgdA/CDA1 family)